MSIKNIILVGVGIVIVVLLLALGIGISKFIWDPLQANPVFSQSQLQISKTTISNDFINMTEDDFNRIKETQIMKMIVDTAKVNNIKPVIFVGLSWHESSKFKFANKKIKDSNGRWSYGLFMIQLETARLYDKEVTEEKLLTPTYNTHLAALIWKKNSLKYGNNIDYILAAHNAGAVYHNKITNPDFVKQVKTAIGDVVSLYDL